MRKKFLCACALACALAIGVMTACSQASGPAEGSSAGSPSSGTERPTIVCTTFAAYDWTRAVLGDELEGYDLVYLLDDGVDLHSYQPTVEDVALISDCDLFVYVGGESDGWVEDALANAKNDQMHVINMLEEVGAAAREEEIVEGMQAEGDDDEDAGHDHDHDEEAEYDEHVWLSLRCAETIVSSIERELSEIDPAHADELSANAGTYIASLDELDARYQQAVSSARLHTVLFADRFPFRYLVEDYGLDYYAAFVGCSAETEASFETVAFLADKVDEIGLSNVLVIEGSDQRIAQTVIDSAEAQDVGILVMDSLQSTTAEQISSGVTYLSVMEENLSVLELALS